MNLVGVTVILLLGIAANKLIALPQLNRIHKQLLAIKKSAPISSVGLQKHWMGARAYVLLAEKDGTIRRGYKLDGNTVFSKFEEDLELKAKTAQELLNTLKRKRKLSRLELAQKMAANFLNNRSALADQEENLPSKA